MIISSDIGNLYSYSHEFWKMWSKVVVITIRLKVVVIPLLSRVNGLN